MGATQNLQNPFPLPDSLTPDFLIPYAFAGAGIAVSVADAMYYRGSNQNGDVAYPADQLASLGSEALDQIQFARLFLGYSQQKILAAETNALKRLVLRLAGPVTARCPSQAWKHGDLVGIYSNGVTIDPQQVDRVTQRALAIGVCIDEQPVAATVVTFEMRSRLGYGMMESLQFAAMGEQQSMNGANVLADANQTFTVATPFFSTLLNAGARTITLPKESASRGLQFMVHNLAASTGSVSWAGSTGGAILGTATIAAGKTGTVFCDGTNWYSLAGA